jgi:hypothetical protein
MSDRLTSKWMSSLEEVFGEAGSKGMAGEEYVARAIASWGWEVQLHPDDPEKQISGVDVAFKNPTWKQFYTADVKANLDQYGTFFVETDDKGWLFNPKKTSHRIWHVNVATGWMAWYDRRRMREYVEDREQRNTGLMKIPASLKLNFITRRKVEC